MTSEYSLKTSKSPRRVFLKLVDGHRVEEVTLAVGAPLVNAAWVEVHRRARRHAGRRPWCGEIYFLRDGWKPDAFDARGGLREILVDD